MCLRKISDVSAGLSSYFSFSLQVRGDGWTPFFVPNSLLRLSSGKGYKGFDYRDLIQNVQLKNLEGEQKC